MGCRAEIRSRSRGTTEIAESGKSSPETGGAAVWNQLSGFRQPLAAVAVVVGRMRRTGLYYPHIAMDCGLSHSDLRHAE